MANTANLIIRAAAASAADSILSAEYTNLSTDTETMEVYLDVEDVYGNARGATYSDTVVFSLDGETFNGSLVGDRYVADVDIPDVADTYSLSATVNGNAVTPINITVSVGNADVGNSSIIIPVASQSADVGTVLIAVALEDADENAIGDGETVVITLDGDSQTATWNGANSRYEYTFTNPNVADDYTVTATVGGNSLTNDGSYTVTPGVPTDAESDITVSPSTISANGTSTITVTLQDQYSNNLTGDGGVTDITFGDTPDGLTFGAVALNGDGTATATATSTVADTYSIDFTLVF